MAVLGKKCPHSSSMTESQDSAVGPDKILIVGQQAYFFEEFR